MLKISYVSADWKPLNRQATQQLPFIGGAGWYRVVIPGDALASAGHEVIFSPYVGVDENDEMWVVDWQGQKHKDLDVIVLQRWMHEEAAGVIGRAVAGGQVVINDIDDWFFGIHPKNYAYHLLQGRQEQGLANRAEARQKGIKTNTVSSIEHYRRALKASSAITCSTPYLAEQLREVLGGADAPPIFVIRNAINLDRWNIKNIHPEKPTIGWVGVTSHRSGDVETLAGILGPFIERHDLDFFHGGDKVDHPSFATVASFSPKATSKVRTMPTQPPQVLTEFYSQFDVGIAPLSDNPFNRSKSWIKILEYSAAGIPFVAQALPEYETFGEGILCERPKDWIRGLTRLLDRDERIQMGLACRKRAEREDIAVRWKEWETAYSEAMAGVSA